MQKATRTRSGLLLANLPIALGLVLVVLAAPQVVFADYNYTDGSFGIAITFPDRTAVTRVTSPAGETGTEIGQFSLPDGNTVGRLVVSDLPENWTFAKALDLVREQLARDAKAEPDAIDSEKIRVRGNYKGATLLQTWDPTHKLHNAILIVQGPSDQMLLLYLATRETPKEDARKITRRIAEGFDVLLQAKDEQKYQSAIARGSAMLMGIAAPIPNAEDLWQSQYFLIQGDKDPLGYIVVSEAAQDRAGRPGIRMNSEKWVFLSPTTAEYESQSAYATWDLHEDEWSSHSETVVDAPAAPPGQPQPPVRPVIFDQKVLRLGQQLLMEATDPKADARSSSRKVNRVVPCPRNFMPQAWRWILPRLLIGRPQVVATSAPATRPGAAGDWLAVVTYSPLRRGLETQMLSRATHGQVRQILQREGLYGETETWAFDGKGHLRQVSAAGFRLIPTTKAEVDRLFAARIAKWRGRVNPQKPESERKAP